MGSSQSVIQRSKAGDTVPNLKWAIKETTRWQQVCKDLEAIATDESDYADWRHFVTSKQDGGEDPPAVAEEEEEDEKDETQQHQVTVNTGWRRRSLSMPGLRRPTAPPSPHIRSAQDLVRISLDPVSNEEQDLQQIQAKKDSVAYLLTQLVVSAEGNYELQCRQEVLKDWVKKLKHKPIRQEHLKEEIKKLDDHLAESLWVWDNARAAAEWLQDVVLLNVRQKKIKDALRDSTDQQVRTAQANSDREGTQTKYAMEDVKALREQVHSLFDDSLEIGFNWLDTNRSQRLEPSDVPEFSAEQFAMLDAKGKHSVSCADLRKRMKQLHQEAEKLDSKFKLLEKDGRELDKRLSKLERTTSPNREQRKTMDRLLIRMHHLGNKLAELDEQRQMKLAQVSGIEDMLLSSFSSNVYAILTGREIIRTYVTQSGEMQFNLPEQQTLRRPEGAQPKPYRFEPVTKVETEATEKDASAAVTEYPEATTEEPGRGIGQTLPATLVSPPVFHPEQGTATDLTSPEPEMETAIAEQPELGKRREELEAGFSAPMDRSESMFLQSGETPQQDSDALPLEDTPALLPPPGGFPEPEQRRDWAREQPTQPQGFPNEEEEEEEEEAPPPAIDEETMLKEPMEEEEPEGTVMPVFRKYPDFKYLQKKTSGSPKISPKLSDTEASLKTFDDQQQQQQQPQPQQQRKETSSPRFGREIPITGPSDSEKPSEVTVTTADASSAKAQQQQETTGLSELRPQVRAFGRLSPGPSPAASRTRSSAFQTPKSPTNKPRSPITEKFPTTAESSTEIPVTIGPATGV